MEQFLLDLRVQENFVGNVAESQLPIDVADEPPLRDEGVDGAQRYHISAFDLTPSPHTTLVSLLVAEISKILQKRDEYVFGVVLFELPLLCFFGLLRVVRKWGVVRRRMLTGLAAAF